MSRSQQDEIQEIVNDIIETIPMRDLVAFSNMDESGVEVLQQAFELYIRRRFGEDDELPEIMEALWKRVRETHRLRTVK